MKINNIGYEFTHTPDFYISRPQGSGDNLLILLRSSAVFDIDGKEIKARKNSFILYKKDTPQFYRADGAEFINDWFHFSCSCDEEEMLGNMNIPFDTLIETGNADELSILIKNMSYEFFSKNKYRSYSLELYLKLFFAKLGESMEEENGGTDRCHYEKLKAVRSRIYSTPQYRWSVPELAREAAMSISYFEHTYKELFGVSVMSDVISSRIEYACFMLLTADVPVGLIGKMCGYKSDVHFLRQFKARTGYTPAEYRKNGGR